MAEKLTRLEKMFTEETIEELANWLIIDASYTENQLEHLKNEKLYLPLISLANDFWLIGALTQQLKDKNVWSLLPVELTSYLSEIEKVYLERSQALSQEAIDCCKTFQKKNIEVMMLKGITGLFNGSYKVISERFMTDIDLLVREYALQESCKTLKEVGYIEQPEDFNINAVEHHHAPPLIREGGCCFIELHRWGLKKSVSEVLTTKEIWRDSVILNLEDDLQVLQLSPTHQFILAIAHSELSNKNHDYKEFDLKQIHNVYIIANFYYQDINWESVQEHFSRARKEYILNGMLFCVNKLFSFSTPITQIIDDNASKHYRVILKNFISTQGRMTLIKRIKGIVRSYREEAILHYYGRYGYFPVFTGRLKHFNRHCKMLYSAIFCTIK